ncbi:hypothetical protein MHBO_001485 [Bonamia ostreae]|uniref:F-box domain-containing protein n=1 Tax=Bonamia ostreae TaxID=126728 RepID=A0ABV2AJ36_9EUKA
MEDIFENEIKSALDLETYESLKFTLLALNEKPDKHTFLPEDAMFNVIRFLDQSDISNLACASKALRNICNSPLLWTELDLRPYWHKSDDLFVQQLLNTSEKFTNIETLKIDMCRALTNKSLRLFARRCRKLKRLSMFRCPQITQEEIIQFAKKMPLLESIEFYGSVFSLNALIGMVVSFPQLDIGVNAFILSAHKKIAIEKVRMESRENSASLQMARLSQTESSISRSAAKPESSEFAKISQLKLSAHINGVSEVYSIDRATCDFKDSQQASPCWGELKSQVIFGDREFEISGNFPTKVIFACEGHLDMITSVGITECEYCHKYLEDESCVNDIICRLCCDRYSFANKKNWITIKRKNLEKISIGQISNTIKIANPKNIPPFLILYDSVELNISLMRTAQNDHSNSQDLARSATFEEDTPFSDFWSTNRSRIEEASDRIAQILKNAKKEKGANRAVFVYDDSEEIGIYISKGSVNIKTHAKETISVQNFTKSFWWLILPIIFLLTILFVFKSNFLAELPIFYTDNLRSLKPIAPLSVFLFVAIFIFMRTIFLHNQRVLKIINIITNTFLSLACATIFFFFFFFNFRMLFLPFDLLSLSIFTFNLCAASFILTFVRISYSSEILIKGVYLTLTLTYYMQISTHIVLITLIFYFAMEIVILTSPLSNNFLALFSTYGSEGDIVFTAKSFI